MTSAGAVARPRAGARYVLVVAALALALCVLANVGAISPEAVWLVAVPLGPIGLAVSVPLLIASAGVATSGSVPVPALVGIDAVILAAVLAVAVANVAVVTRIRGRAAATPTPASFRGRVPLAWDRILGGGGFIKAAALHVLLCAVAGFIALLAGGVDVPTPAAQADAVRAACGVAWVLGSIAAVGGVVLWVVTARGGRAMLRWALADVVVQTVALAGLVAVTNAMTP